MSLEVKRKEKETPQKLVRRFAMRIRQSGILKKARACQFFQRPLSKTKKKLQALRREKIKKELEKLEKMGR
jgi:ribosomal protein S21